MLPAPSSWSGAPKRRAAREDRGRAPARLRPGATGAEGDRLSAITRDETIRELHAITDFQAEVFEPVRRQWAGGFAVRSEFPRPGARELHAAALRRRGLTNEEISALLRVDRSRVTVLAWRGEGFLLSVEGNTRYEDARRDARRRL